LYLESIAIIKVVYRYILQSYLLGSFLLLLLLKT